ncbi:MAG: hypothetical protein J7K89_08330 [Candidatus Cloacimonetes bacterium]|nr:hypothetical protein [Candidatus Cloacimonadota bacterium]
MNKRGFGCRFYFHPSSIAFVRKSQEDDFALDKLAKRTRDYLHIIVPQSTMNIDVCAEGNEFNL